MQSRDKSPSYEMVFAASALECLQWIRRGSDQDALPGNITHVASALTTILHLVKYVEDETSTSNFVGGLSIGIYAKASRPPPQHQIRERDPPLTGRVNAGRTGLDCKFFCLWKPLRTPNNCQRNNFTTQQISKNRKEKRKRPSSSRIASQGSTMNEAQRDDNDDEDFLTSSSSDDESKDGPNPSSAKMTNLTSKAALAANEGTLDILPVSPLPPGQPISSQENVWNDVGVDQTNGSNLPSGHDYEVPIDISAWCTSLMLEGAGYRTHPFAIRAEGYEDLHCNDLQNVVSMLHKYEEQRPRESTTNLNDEGVTSSGKENMQRKRPLLYKALIPDHLRDKNVHIPIVRLIRSPTANSCAKDGVGFQLDSRMMVDLKGVRKPDRNRKEQNFAILCISIHHFGPDGSSGKALLEYAQKGRLFRESCSVWQQQTKSKNAKALRRKSRNNNDNIGRKSGTVDTVPEANNPTTLDATAPKTICGGPDRCIMEPTGLCTLILKENGKTVEVGKGTVHPRVTYYKGGRVPSSSFLVRVAEVNPSTSHKKVLDKWDVEPIIWNRSCVSRVTVLGPHSDPVGSAILVNDKPWKEPECGLPNFRGRRKARKKESISLSRAVVLCDVRLNEEMNHANATSTAYPYAEWYDRTSMEYLVKLHFTDGIVPSNLLSLTTGFVVELLWDGGMIRSLGD